MKRTQLSNPGRAGGKSAVMMTVISLGMVSMSLWAQDDSEVPESTEAEETPVGTLPTTVITGQTSDVGTRSEKKLEDVPASITVIPDEEIARIAPRSFDDITRMAPNVETQGGPRYLGEQVNIRGEGGNAVTVRVDDARQNFVSGHAGQRFFVETDFLNRVDILRGAGSFLYGSGSAGVINLDTYDPEDLLNPDGWGFRMRNTYNDNSEEWANSWMGAVGTDHFSFLYGYADRQGNDIRLPEGDMGEERFVPDSSIDRNSHLAKMVFTPSEEHRFELGYSRYDTSDEGGANPQADVGTSNARVGRGIDFSQWTGDYQFNPFGTDLINVDLTVYYNETSQTRNYLDPTGSNMNRQNVHQLDVLGVDFANRSEFMLGELEHELTFGVEFFTESQEGTETRDTFFIPGATGFSSNRPNAEAEHFGIYVTDEIDLSSRFTLFTGLRHDSYETRKTIGSIVEQSDGALSPHIGFDLDLTEKLSLVGRYSRAFTEPTLNSLYNDGSHFGVVPNDPFFETITEPSGGFFLPPNVPPAGQINVNYFEEIFVPNDELLPEESDNFELGLHFEDEDFAGGELVARVNGFYKQGKNTVDSEIVGMAVTDPYDGGFATPDDVPAETAMLGPFGPTATFFTGINFNGTLTQAFRQSVNRAETEIYGAEFSLEYDADTWFGGLAFGSVRGEDSTTGANLNSLLGDQLSATLGTRFKDGKYELGIYGIWNAGKEHIVSDPFFQTSGYDLYGLFATMHVTDNFSLRVGVDNLFDQSYERTSILLEEPGRNGFFSATFQW